MDAAHAGDAMLRVLCYAVRKGAHLQRQLAHELRGADVEVRGAGLGAAAPLVAPKVIGAGDGGGRLEARQAGGAVLRVLAALRVELRRGDGLGVAEALLGLVLLRGRRCLALLGPATPEKAGGMLG